MAMKDRREELIVAAIRVMTRDGVARTTTRAVVSEAGMTLGVFHTGEHPVTLAVPPKAGSKSRKRTR